MFPGVRKGARGFFKKMTEFWSEPRISIQLARCRAQIMIALRASAAFSRERVKVNEGSGPNVPGYARE